MDSNLVAQAAQATLQGTLDFPQLVHMLLEAGVEYYHVDYVARRKNFYSASGAMLSAPIPYEDLPAVGTDFDAQALRDAIKDSQYHAQTYHDFSKRAMRAGVQGYIAFLRGQRVTYWGRQGDQHTEWFPGAQP